MKRLHVLLFSLLSIGFCVAAGFSDSGVTKQTATYQTTVQDDNSDILFSFEFEKSEFVLNAPELGKATLKNILLIERSPEGYFVEARPPPDQYCQKSVYL